MLKSYLLTSLRFISRNKLFAIINITGLSLGMACFILSYYHINNEYNFDRHYSRDSDIYRLVTGDVKSGEGWVKVSAPLPEKLTADIPEIQAFTRLTRLDRSSKTALSLGSKVFYEKDFFLADPAVVDFFDLTFVAGDPAALEDLKTMIISRSKAEQLFGTRDPIGEIVRINDAFDFTIGGVYEDFSTNSHLNMDFVVSFLNLESLKSGTNLKGNWGQFNYFAYVLLHPDASEAAVEEKIRQIKVRLNEENVFSMEEINLQPLADIHFQYNRGNLKPTYDSRNAYIYGLAALAILIISIINYINLSTAGSTRRLKEIGLRKTVGASRLQLILQFIGESLIITLIAGVLAWLANYFWLLNRVNSIFDSHLEINLTNPVEWIMLLGIIILISGVAGAYIAYYILNVQPIKALKGQVNTASGKHPIRNVLVSLQFIIAITLLSSALFIQSQLKLIHHQDIGLTKEGVINIPLYDPEWKKDIGFIKRELENLSFVEKASATRFQAGIANWHQTVWWEGQQEDISMNIISADADLFHTLGLELQSGKLDYITNDLRQDLAYVLNESAATIIGELEAVGKSFTAFGADSRKPIAGIVKDFNYKSLHHAIEPCVLVLGGDFKADNLLVKIKSGSISAALEGIKAKLAVISPNVSFEYSFLEENFDALYKQEQRSQQIVTFYTSISVLLSILGLFGIISFELNERRKEMAVRKILGISEFGMGTLISMKFLKILGGASLIAIPLSWYFLQQWLQNFTYRIDLKIDLFVLSILIVLVLIIATIMIKWLQFRRVNLAEVLKYE